MASVIRIAAGLSVAFFIVICFEIGVLLVILPWDQSWYNNRLLLFAAERLHSPWLFRLMMSGFVRGAVSGLGLLNVVLGIWEIVNFRKTVRAFAAEWEGEEGAAKTPPTVVVYDNGSEQTENQDRNAEERIPD